MSERRTGMALDFILAPLTPAEEASKTAGSETSAQSDKSEDERSDESESEWSDASELGEWSDESDGESDEESKAESDAEKKEMYLLQPPPEETFPSAAVAESLIHAWTREHGFNVTHEKAPKNAFGEAKFVFFACSQAGKPKNTRKLEDADRVRELRGSMRKGCSMRIKMVPVDELQLGGPWQIVYTRDGSHLHNHPRADDVSIFPALRRVDAEMALDTIVTLRDLARVQAAAGVSVGQAHATMMIANPHSLATPQDFANARAAARLSDLAHQTSIEALLEQLQLHGFWYRYVVDAITRELVRLLCAHPETLALYKEHPDVLIMDCTYKTNTHDMPLLNIVTMTGFNTVLPVVQCWMPGENEDDYSWALRTLRELMDTHGISPPHVSLSDRDLACMNAVDTIFEGIPAMVCRWHMNQNVLAKTRSVLGQIENPFDIGNRFVNSPATDAFMALYYEAIDAETERAFGKACESLRATNAALGAYLDRHWWKYKKRVARCWTKKYHHFGFQDTSPIEGTHAKIKKWLGSSKGDLYTAFQKLLPWWTGVARKLRYKTQKDVTIIPHCLLIPRYAKVVRVIAVWALYETHKLWKDAQRIVKNRLARSICSNSFRCVHGRPCIHELVALIEKGDTLEPSDFNRYWWIPGADAHAAGRIFAPAHVSKRRKKTKDKKASHRRNHGDHGTARDPTLAERIDLNNPAPAPSFQSQYASIPVADVDGDTFFDVHAPTRSWGYAGRHGY